MESYISRTDAYPICITVLFWVTNNGKIEVELMLEFVDYFDPVNSDTFTYDAI